MAKSLAIKLASILCSITATATVSGVSATWFYANTPADNKNLSFGLQMGEWPEDVILPGTAGDTEAGENYKMLMDAILNSKKAGLNPTDLLEDAIWNSKKNPHLGILYNQQGVTGGNQDHLFDKDTTAGTAALDFVMESVNGSETEYYFYLFNDNDAKGVTLVDNLSTTRISVYRTHVVQTNGKWTATGTMHGKAYVTVPEDHSFRSIKIDTWVNT